MTEVNIKTPDVSNDDDEIYRVGDYFLADSFGLVQFVKSASNEYCLVNVKNGNRLDDAETMNCADFLSDFTMREIRKLNNGKNLVPVKKVSIEAFMDG